MATWLVAALGLSALGLLLGLGLGGIGELWSGEDGLVERILALLPGANCGACGRSGCRTLATELARGLATPAACPILEASGRERLAKRLGVVAPTVVPRVAVVACQRSRSAAVDAPTFLGPADCRVAARVAPEISACPDGCLGFGTCLPSCAFGALALGSAGVPVVDSGRCKGCGLCVAACPQGVIEMVERGQTPVLLCHSTHPARELKTCPEACLACAVCVRACPTAVLTAVGGRPVLKGDCLACFDCVAACPRHVLVAGDGP